MKNNPTVTSDRWQVTGNDAWSSGLVTRHSSPATHRAFSLVEVLLVVTLLSLIVMALMAVFSSTQRAFRASVTQTDVLEGGRMAVDLISSDLRGLTPSGGSSNAPGILPSNPYPFTKPYYFQNRDFVNFYVDTSLYYTTPLTSSLPGSTAGRTNVLQCFYILSRDNINGRDSWVGTGYVVDFYATNFLYPLYRFNMSSNVTAIDPNYLFNTYMGAVVANDFSGPNWSHLVDGVIDLRVHAYDTAGGWLNWYYFPTNVHNVRLVSPVFGETGMYMFSNAVPAAVELELGILEDRALARAESLPVTPVDRRTPFLQKQAGSLHVFRQRVTIPNVDPSAFQ